MSVLNRSTYASRAIYDIFVEQILAKRAAFSSKPSMTNLATGGKTIFALVQFLNDELRV